MHPSIPTDSFLFPALVFSLPPFSFSIRVALLLILLSLYHPFCTDAREPSKEKLSKKRTIASQNREKKWTKVSGAAVQKKERRKEARKSIKPKSWYSLVMHTLLLLSFVQPDMHIFSTILVIVGIWRAVLCHLLADSLLSRALGI